MHNYNCTGWADYWWTDMSSCLRLRVLQLHIYTQLLLQQRAIPYNVHSTNYRSKGRGPGQRREAYCADREAVLVRTRCMVKEHITTMCMSSSRNVPATRAPFVFYVTIYGAMLAQVLPTSERLWGHVPTPKHLRCSRNVPPPPPRMVSRLAHSVSIART